MKLYIYDHCPFCARVRLLAGYKKIPLELVYMPYAEEEMLVKLVGKKAVPILQKDDGSIMAESLDILLWLDQNYGTPGIEAGADVDAWLSDALLPLQKIGYPRWPQLNLKEFEREADRDEWEKRKAPAIGSFSKALKETAQTAKEASVLLERAASLLGENITGPLSMAEIKLFGFIRGFTSEPSIIWPEKLRKWFELRQEQSGMRPLL